MPPGPDRYIGDQPRITTTDLRTVQQFRDTIVPVQYDSGTTAEDKSRSLDLDTLRSVMLHTFRGRRLRATGDAAQDRANLLAVLSDLQHGDTLEIDGQLRLAGANPVADSISIGKRLRIVGVGRESGFDLRGAVTLYAVGAVAIVNYASDTAWVGSPAGRDYVDLPTSFADQLQVGDQIYLYSGDALTGLTPHYAAGGGIQCPGECHRVRQIGSASGGVRRVSLHAPLLDAMTITPRVNLRSQMRALHGMEWRNLTIRCGDQANRTTTNALDLRDTAGTLVEGCTLRDRVGMLYLDGPAHTVSGCVVEVYNPTLGTYAVVLGGMCADVRVSDCRIGPAAHGVTTTGYAATPPAHGSLSRIGTPTGVVHDCTLHGIVSAPLDTHAEGQMTFRDCEVSIAGTSARAVNIRSRNTIVSGCRIRGNDTSVAMSLCARGAVVRGCEVEECYLGIYCGWTSYSGQACVIDDVQFRRVRGCPIVIDMSPTDQDIVISRTRYRQCCDTATAVPLFRRAYITTLAAAPRLRLLHNDFRPRDNLAQASIDFRGSTVGHVVIRGCEHDGWPDQPPHPAGPRTTYGYIGTHRDAAQAAAQVDYCWPAS